MKLINSFLLVFLFVGNIIFSSSASAKIGLHCPPPKEIALAIRANAYQGTYQSYSYRISLWYGISYTDIMKTAAKNNTLGFTFVTFPPKRHRKIQPIMCGYATAPGGPNDVPVYIESAVELESVDPSLQGEQYTTCHNDLKACAFRPSTLSIPSSM